MLIGVILFAAVMIGVSVFILARPDLWERFVVWFCGLKYMHPAEILIRALFAWVFLSYADQSRYPALFTVLGYVLLSVAIALVVTPPSIHRRFAIWAVRRFAGFWRPMAVGTLAFGVLIVYAAF